MAIVTGGGSGIGWAVSLALANEGYSVAVAGRRVEPLERCVRDIKRAGHEGIAVPTDVRNPASVGALFRAVRETYGRLDCAFNNAATLPLLYAFASFALDDADPYDRAGWPALRERIAARLATRTRDEWLAVFDGTDACVAPVLSLTEAPEHPHLAARRTYVTAHGVRQPAPAPRFDATPAGLGPPHACNTSEQRMTNDE